MNTSLSAKFKNEQYINEETCYMIADITRPIIGLCPKMGNTVVVKQRLSAKNAFGMLITSLIVKDFELYHTY